MSVDVSGLIDAIDAYAVSALDCIGEHMQQVGSGEAPVDTGELSDSVRWEGAGGGGGAAEGLLSVEAYYGWFTTQDELHGHPLMVFEAGGETVFARVVHPSRPDWWQNTLDEFPGSVGGCG